MTEEEVYERYLELQRWIDWSEEDALRVRAAAPVAAPLFDTLVSDFYETIQSRPETRGFLSGGPARVEALKRGLMAWLGDLFSGRYDREFVARRWRAGRIHVEIGLGPTDFHAALARLRNGLLRALAGNWRDGPDELHKTVLALGNLLDLDLAIIEETYQSVYEERLRRTERLGAIGQVAAGIAHELGNPLQSIRNSVAYLRRTVEGGDALREIDRQVDVAQEVIRALTDFVRLPEPRRGRVQLATSTRTALAAERVPGTIRVHADLPEGLPTVEADEGQLLLVFGNLIRNAVEAMPGGGELRISARREDRSVEVVFEDTGVGIPPGDLAHVLEPLTTSKARGLGLGLAICHAIVEKHRGELRVRSERGRGSVFTVRLPLGSG
jgi:signal transduction histidine kinase